MSDGPDQASRVPDDLAKRIYAETRAFYSHLEPRLGFAALGFKILYGPPCTEPLRSSSATSPAVGCPTWGSSASGAHEAWPATCDYATAACRLAAALRNIFGPEYLSCCVGLNAIVLRAPRVDVYEATVSPGLRSEIGAFCLPRARAIITELEPQRVIVIGFGRARLFGSAEPVLWGKRGSIFAKRVRIADIDALAIPHLTGPRLSASDRVAIAGTLLGGPPPGGRRVLTSGPAASRRSSKGGRRWASGLAPRNPSLRVQRAAPRRPRAAVVTVIGIRVAALAAGRWSRRHRDAFRGSCAPPGVRGRQRPIGPAGRPIRSVGAVAVSRPTALCHDASATPCSSKRFRAPA